MTEFWVSQKNKWCEYCKVWLKDTAQSWAVHERGVKHQENVARKLRDMRQTADREKKEQEQLEATMSKVEREAQKRYEADRKAAEEHRKATLGEWVWNAEAGYYYNAVHRWYYDTNTAMYYGGDPVEWTDKPSLPHEARYEVMNKPPPVPAAAAAATGGGSGSAGVAAAAASGSGSAARPAAAGARPVMAGQQYAVAGSRIVNKHPLSEVGGYQLHSIQGSIGGAKGVGSSTGGGGGRVAAPAAAAAAADAKRKREGAGKELSKEDQEFLARREAARQRVQARTAANFGLS